MVVPHADRERVHPESRAQWRAWLDAHHATSEGVWLVGWKSSTGRPRMSYEDQVCEALCVGWIDSTQRTLDDERTMMWYAPRRSASNWSRSNKERVDRLTAAGLMRPAGLAAVEAARRSGAWNRLDDVEDLVVPDDLAAALDDRARAYWDGLPRSVRRVTLASIADARRPPTRARRIAAAAERLAKGERPGP
jgi:uncharacterized protein YdeI (YjbR/CyaY-like superfamily)